MKITDWDKHYENAQSRKVHRLSWVPVPNKHDGERYSELMSRKDAPLIFTAWILMLQVASRSQCRGSLLRDDGRPHDATSLALKTRGNVEWFKIAIPILLKMKWLDDSTEPTSSVLPDDYQHATALPGQKGREGKGTEENGTESAEFSEFWKAFPINKGKRSDAWKQWDQLGCQQIAEIVTASVKNHARLADWNKNGGLYIPSATLFLKERRWENKIQLASQGYTSKVLQPGEDFK